MGRGRDTSRWPVGAGSVTARSSCGLATSGGSSPTSGCGLASPCCSTAGCTTPRWWCRTGSPPRSRRATSWARWTRLADGRVPVVALEEQASEPEPTVEVAVAGTLRRDEAASQAPDQTETPGEPQTPDHDASPGAGTDPDATSARLGRVWRCARRPAGSASPRCPSNGCRVVRSRSPSAPSRCRAASTRRPSRCRSSPSCAGGRQRMQSRLRAQADVDAAATDGQRRADHRRDHRPQRAGDAQGPAPYRRCTGRRPGSTATAPAEAAARASSVDAPPDRGHRDRDPGRPGSGSGCPSTTSPNAPGSGRTSSSRSRSATSRRAAATSTPAVTCGCWPSVLGIDPAPLLASYDADSPALR